MATYQQKQTIFDMDFLLQDMQQQVPTAPNLFLATTNESILDAESLEQEDFLNSKVSEEFDQEVLIELVRKEPCL